jgi:hypothetical protein
MAILTLALAATILTIPLTTAYASALQVSRRTPVLYQMDPMWRGLCYGQIINFTSALPGIKFVWLVPPPTDEQGTWDNYWSNKYGGAWDNQDPRTRPFVTQLIDQGHWVAMKGVYIPSAWVSQGLVTNDDPAQDIRGLDYQHKLYAISQGKLEIEHLFGRPVLVGGDKWYDQEILDAAYAAGFKYWFGNDATIEDHTRFGTTNFDFGGKHYDGHGMINVGYTYYYPLDLMSNNWQTLKSFMSSKQPLSLDIKPKGWLANYDAGTTPNHQPLTINAESLVQINNYLVQNYRYNYFYIPPYP